MIMKRRTTTQKINTAISNNLLQIKRAEIYDKGTNKTETINGDKFRENFEYFCESGVFMDCIGWHYERNPVTNGYIIECGRTNAASDKIISVIMDVCDGVTEEEIEKILLFEEE